MSFIRTLKSVSNLIRYRNISISNNTTNHFNLLRNKSIKSNFYKAIHTSSNLCHGEYERQPPNSEDDVVNIKFFDRDGIEFNIKGKVNDNLMFLAQVNDVDVEGACEASLACCTCHVYIEEEYFDKLDEADLKEEDLLDMAPFLAENSRLSCQITLRKDMEGMTVRLPMGTRNMRVDQK